ncbi:MAG: sensor histidine kinase [Flavobacteriales bacterium]|nr:sensor histidine kinase [Flavobacteriales bacterium]
MKKSLIGIFLLVSVTVFAQKNYIDSVEIAIKNLSTEEQVRQVLAIPHDKVLGNTVKSEKLFSTALEHARLIQNKELEADVCTELALIYAYLGDYGKRLTHDLRAIVIYESIGNHSKAGNTYGNLGYSMRLRDLNKAKYYMKKGIELLEKEENEILLNPIYDNYGILLQSSGNLDSAILFFNKALELKIKQKDSIGIPFALGHLSGVYLEKKDFIKSKAYLDQAYNIRKKRNDIYGIAECLVLYGDYYFAQKNYLEAITWMEACYKMALENNYIHMAQYAAEHLSLCFENTKSPQKAIDYLRIHQSLKDSLLNESTNKTIAELEIQFETEKNEKQIAEQKIEIAKKELESKTKTNTLILISAILLIVVLSGFFIYKQQKQKQQQLLEENRLKDQLALVKIQNEIHEERLRISRDLHDNIGSQLTFIISSVDNMKYLFKTTDEKLNNKLRDISSFTKTTITQLRDTIWALNQEQITFGDLTGRLQNYITTARSAQEQITFEFENTIKSNYLLNTIQGVNCHRIVQESINNSIKYSAASRIKLILMETSKSIVVSIEDDGIGFDLNHIQTGNGLLNMKNRAKKINASLNIESKPDTGTKITLIIPKDTLNVV